MDRDTIRRLNELNRRFYAQTAPHFNKTRQSAWSGWQQMLPFIPASTDPLRVLDIGCGNGRFGAFLADHLQRPIHYTGLDNSPELLAYAEVLLSDRVERVTLREQDVVASPPSTGLFDLVVLFGVIHHIPGYDDRHQFMRVVAQHVVAGGQLVFATWRFYEFERFRKRIIPWDTDWQVEAHDYLLDWQRGTTALRYCHYVDNTEHQSLIAATGLHEQTRFRADGKSNDLNCYSILRND